MKRAAWAILLHRSRPPRPSRSAPVAARASGSAAGHRRTLRPAGRHLRERGPRRSRARRLPGRLGERAVEGVSIESLDAVNGGATCQSGGPPPAEPPDRAQPLLTSCPALRAAPRPRQRHGSRRGHPPHPAAQSSRRCGAAWGSTASANGRSGGGSDHGSPHQPATRVGSRVGDIAREQASRREADAGTERRVRDPSARASQRPAAQAGCGSSRRRALRDQVRPAVGTAALRRSSLRRCAPYPRGSASPRSTPTR